MPRERQCPPAHNAPFRKSLTEVQELNICDMYEQGHTIAECATEYSVSYGTAHAVLVAHNVPRRARFGR